MTTQVSNGIEARVSRVLGFGALSRIELTGADDQHFEVETTRDDAQGLALQPGQRVWLVPRRLSVFEAGDAKPRQNLAAVA